MTPAVAPAATVAADSPVLPAATLPAEEPAAQATVPDVATPTIAVPADSTPQATVPPATGGSGGVVIVGSNAFVEESSFTIDGEGRTLYMVAALRNEGSDTVKVSEVTLTIRDAAGAVIGTREEYPIDRVLVPGETTYLYEFTPSMMYWESETNTFPEGWASFDLAYDVESPYVADEWDDVNLSVENVVVGRSGGDVTATGTIRNTSTVPVSSSAEVYVALYDAQGNLLSVAWTYATSGDVDVLQPGDTVPFELPVWFGPQEYDTTVVGAVASPSS